MFREHKKRAPHNIPPNAQDLRSDIQVQLNASCWQKTPATSSRSAVKLNCLPSFVLIGAPRSGSTTLFDNLKRHDNIMLWETWDDKELNFLNWKGKYDRHYAEVMPPLPAGLNAITGEASVRYFMHPQVRAHKKSCSGVAENLVVWIQHKRITGLHLCDASVVGPTPHVRDRAQRKNYRHSS